MTVRIEITAGTVSEALEQARELGGEGPGVLPISGMVQDEELVKPGVETHVVPGPTTVSFDGSQESKGRVVEMFGKGSPVERTVNSLPPPNAALELNPQTPAAPAPTVTPEPDRDARGIPWDARVHAGNKATTQDGSWKKRRGVDPVELIRVEEELKAQIIPAIAALPTADAPPPPPPETEAPPVTFASLFAEAKGLGYTVEQLDAMAIQVTNGEVTKVALLADKAAYVQAIHDLLVPNG